MITEEFFREVMNCSEEQTIDFKAEPHRLDNEHFKSEYIKDIVSMANTPREKSAYIIIGIKLHNDGTRDLLGVGIHPDDSDLQDLVKSNIDPVPSFTYQTITIDNISYGVIEIKKGSNGPYYPKKDFGVLKADKLYYRLGTKNSEANQQQERDYVFRFFYPNQMKNFDAASANTNSSINWDRFFAACHEFDENRLFVYVVGRENIVNTEALSLLARVPINIVLDFDPMTNMEGGIYSSIISDLRKRRSVHLITLGDSYSLYPEKACYWYAMKGLSDRPNTLLANGDWKSWNRKYGQEVQQFINDFSRASSSMPVTVICLFYGPEYIRELSSMFDRAFADAVDYVFAFPDAEKTHDLAKQFSASVVTIELTDILLGIEQNIVVHDLENQIHASIPDVSGTFQIINPADMQWLSEDMEILHSNIDLEVDPKQRVGLDYLRGFTISWADLNHHYDADRDITSKLENLITRDLETRTSTRLNLFHYPGSGGTTIARRIGWNLRRRYPTLLLKRITPGETVGRFRLIFKLTGQTILAIVEGGDALSDKLEQLYTEIKAEQIPVIFLSVLRRFGLNSEHDRSIFLYQTLSVGEYYRFIETYRRVVPDKSSLLDNLLATTEQRYRTPFHLGLACFEKDFVGIQNYVRTRILNTDLKQREIITFIALSYYYGHKAIIAQLFAVALGTLENRRVILENVLADHERELLLQEEGGRWRPVHQLIAEEIIKYVLSSGLGEERNWIHNLSSWSIKFIKLLGNASITPSDETLELLRRVFILRDEHELLGTEISDTTLYSKLIEDIPTNEGKLAVFKELVATFPNEAHFWGHLGRFYSTTLGDHIEAIEAINRAIAINENDPVLYHMKGMCYRRLIYAKITELRNKTILEEELQNFRSLVDSSLKAFEKSRKLDPNTEHSYISPVQLLLRVLEFGYSISKFTSRSKFLISPASNWYREQLDQIEDLMDQVKSLKEGDKLSKYIIDCQSDLDLVYDNYTRAIEGWQNLLSRKDVFAPPVRRQIIRAYLARSNRQWSLLNTREIERIVDLMEDNMLEEPRSSSNIRIWFRAIRYSKRQDIDIALDKLTTWKALGGSIDAYFYTFVLHVLKAIDGSFPEKEIAKDQLKDIREKARNQRNRTRTFEWLGLGKGLQRLLNYSELGEWNENIGFYEKQGLLAIVEGYVSQIKGPEAGILVLTSCDLEAFFVPAKANVYKGKDENRRVTFFLGFSYDGLRAWNVKLIDG